MTDERLLARLRGRGNKDTIAAADRIEELGRLARGQEEQLEIQGNELIRRASHGHKQADRIEALTEQLEAARADAKEAEAYAEELEKEIELNEQEACMLEDDFIKAEKEIDALKAKLSKAVEGLRAFKAFDDMPTKYKRPDVFEVSVRRKLLATLAEIEGEKT